MVKTLDFWAFILANMGVVVAGGLLAALSYFAYRQHPSNSSYRLATIGFGLVVVGSLVNPAYLLGWAVNFQLNSHELLLLIAMEDILIALGLGIIFLAITQHETPTSSAADDTAASIEDEVDWRSLEWSDD